MRMYADYDYYKSGEFGSIPQEQFKKYAKIASQEMDKLTHNRITDIENDSIKDCCCDMADVIYDFYQAHNNENGALVTSYSNDGQSASFDLSTSEFTHGATKKKLLGIAHIYLLPLGLMYLGVR